MEIVATDIAGDMAKATTEDMATIEDAVATEAAAVFQSAAEAHKSTSDFKNKQANRVKHLN